MKILWLTNTALPVISEDAGLSVGNFGGWLSGYANGLTQDSHIELICVFPASSIIDGKVGSISYTSFLPDTEAETKERLATLIDAYNPDVIHVFGTEFSHTRYMLEVCANLGCLNNTVVSIQGLVSICSMHYYAYLPHSVVNSLTIRDAFRRDNIKLACEKFKLRGVDEIAALKIAKHVIGRTDWDEACVKQINPNITYHFCNETLRKSFYSNQWDYDACEKYSIFVSQASYPIKGFHLMLSAFAEIKKKYPQARLYTTGKSVFPESCKDRILESSYTKYLRKLINKLQIRDSIVFLGMLSEEEMCRHFLKSNLFVSCSSIENSPNSLGEAMMLGVPAITSDVGGVKNMLAHEKEGFVYPADEPYMIAYYADRIFSDQELAKTISENARNHAAETHSMEKNTECLKEIYQSICPN